MPAQTFTAFQSDLAHNRFCAVYFLSGSEEYLAQHALLALKDKIVVPDSRAFNLVECSAANGAARILHEANSFPLMPGRRLVIVREIEALPAEEQPELLAYMAAPQSKSILVLLGNPDRRSSWYKKLVEITCTVDCQELKDAALEKWAASMVSRRGYRIGPEALRKLVELAGSDLMNLENEIEKLVIYSGGEKKIKDEAIDLLVPGSRQQIIFDLTNAIGRRDHQAALKLLANQLETGEPVLRILSMMAWQLRRMILAQELLAAGGTAQEIFRTFRLPDQVRDDFMKQIRTMEPRRIRAMYQRLAKIDRSIKSTSPDERMLLERWICSL